MCIICNVIKVQLLSYPAYMVWEVREIFNQQKCKLGFSPSHTSYHRHDITEILLLSNKQQQPNNLRFLYSIGWRKSRGWRESDGTMWQCFLLPSQISCRFYLLCTNFLETWWESMQDKFGTHTSLSNTLTIVSNEQHIEIWSAKLRSARCCILWTLGSFHRKKSLFYLTMFLAHFDFHIIGYWMSSILSLWCFHCDNLFIIEKPAVAI